MLTVITYNCHGLLSGLQDVTELCNQCDLIFLQETWLLKHELFLLNNLHVLFEAFGCSAVDDSDGIVRGRPYGGLGVLIRKSFRPMADFHKYNDSRLLGITIKNNSESFYFLLLIYHTNVMITMTYMLSILVRFQL